MYMISSSNYEQTDDIDKSCYYDRWDDLISNEKKMEKFQISSEKFMVRKEIGLTDLFDKCQVFLLVYVLSFPFFWFKRMSV